MARFFTYGDGDNINCGNSAVINPSTISIGYWFKWGGSAGEHWVIARDDATLGRDYCSGVSGNFRSQIGGGWLGNFPISSNVWYHGGFTGNAASGYIGYLNGDSTGDPVYLNTPVGTATGSTTIGQRTYEGYLGYFDGSIADIAIWNVILTQNEFIALSRGARPFQIRPSSLVGYWPLDGIQSPEPDLSCNAKNGTVTGTTAVIGPPVTMFTPRWPRNIDAVAAWQLYFSKNSGAYEPVTTTSLGVRSADASTDTDDTIIRIPRL